MGVGEILCAFRTSAKPAFFSAVTHKVKMPTMKTSYMFLQVISKTVPSLPLTQSPSLLIIPVLYRSGHCCREQLHSTNTNTFSCPNPQNKDLFSSTPCSTNYFTHLQLWKYSDAYEPWQAAASHSGEVGFSTRISVKLSLILTARPLILVKSKFPQRNALLYVTDLPQLKHFIKLTIEMQNNVSDAKELKLQSTLGQLLLMSSANS